MSHNLFFHLPAEQQVPRLRFLVRCASEQTSLGMTVVTFPSGENAEGGPHPLRLLRVHPLVRARQLDRHIRNKDVEGLAVGEAAMLGGEQNWACLFVACPCCEDAARRLGPAA